MANCTEHNWMKLVIVCSLQVGTKATAKNPNDKISIAVSCLRV